MSEKQKFLLWQYWDLVARIEKLQQEEENEDLLLAMQTEQARMEDEYEVLYAIKPPPPGPPRPPWW